MTVDGLLDYAQRAASAESTIEMIEVAMKLPHGSEAILTTVQAILDAHTMLHTQVKQ